MKLVPRVSPPVLVHQTSTSTSLSTLRSRVADYLQSGLEGAANTRKAYGADLRHYRQWCAGHGEELLPITPDALCAYLAFCAEKDKWATLQRRLSAIRKLHKLNGADDLEVMQQTKRKTSAMIQRYTRVGNEQRYNAGKKLGL